MFLFLGKKCAWEHFFPRKPVSGEKCVCFGAVEQQPSVAAWSASVLSVTVRWWVMCQPREGEMGGVVV